MKPPVRHIGSKQVLAGLSAGVALICLLRAPAAAQELPTPTQNAQAGAAVFGRKGCVRCHSVSGLGGSIGPDLKTVAGGRTFFELAAILWDHLPQMTRKIVELGIERPRLTPQEAGDLVAYLYTLGYFDTPGDPTVGRTLFQKKHCILCHQVGGVGGVVGPNLDYIGERGLPIEIAAAMWNHGPAMAKAARQRGIERPLFRGSELNDLLAYLRSQTEGVAAEEVHALPGRPERGERVLQEKSCIQCHGTPGAGGRIAPDLAWRSRGLGLVEFVAAMWNKAPTMMAAMKNRDIPYPRLEAEEVADLVAYLYSVGYFAGGGRAERGRSVIRRGGCLECHTLDGRGSGTAGDLGSVRSLGLPGAALAAMWNHVVVALGGESEETSWPALSSRDMADLFAFFEASAR